MTRWAVVVVVMGAATAGLANTEVEAVKEETGRGMREWGRSIMEWMGFGGDDYDYDYPTSSASAEVGFGLPSVGYTSSGAHSSYSSYKPYQALSQPNARHDFIEDSKWSLEDKLWELATELVPLGLLIAALPTSLLTVFVRRRSFDGDSGVDPAALPLLNEILEARDYTPLRELPCQRKLFCELSLIGEDENASFLQRAFYYVATLTPDPWARRVGMDEVFRAARAGQCEALVCGGGQQLSSLSPSAALPPSNNLLEDSSSPEPDAEE